MTILDQPRLEDLRTTYRDGLLLDTVPFWTKHAPDREHGGFLTSLDRDGTVIDTDKGMWQQARFSWLLSTLYDDVEPRDEWLDLARHGIAFIRSFGFDCDGRMFFSATREGSPCASDATYSPRCLPSRRSRRTREPAATSKRETKRSICTGALRASSRHRASSSPRSTPPPDRPSRCRSP